jgi:cytochrome c oxidase assembly protein subunit 11
MSSDGSATKVTMKRAANRRLAWVLAIVALGFFGFGFGLVPLYNTLCHFTGLNGKTDETSARPAGGVDLSRTVTVEFMSTVMPGLPWQFRPEERRLRVHPGEPATATYLATNLGGTRLYGQAIMSVTRSRRRRISKRSNASATTSRGSIRSNRASCRSCFS